MIDVKTVPDESLYVAATMPDGHYRPAKNNTSTQPIFVTKSVNKVYAVFSDGSCWSNFSASKTDRWVPCRLTISIEDKE